MFNKGKTLNVETCRDENIFPKVAERMAVLHQQLDYWTIKAQITKDNEAVKVFLWDKIHLFLSLVPDTFKDPVKQERCDMEIYQDTIPLFIFLILDSSYMSLQKVI